jgi:superfamily II DNA or RNA helicase
MLKDLHLVPVYDSADYDLIQDLIIPLLQNSTAYARGVGFFTSGWLRLTSLGLSRLIENGGKAKIVLSPIIERADWEAFQLGEEARTNEVLKKTLVMNIDNIASGLEQATLNTMAWMIADGLLEFKFAVARDYDSGGDYHDKVAVFTDDQGDSVAIHGSFNDSIKGTLNGEAFSVFKSWEDGQRPFVDQHRNRLSELWRDNNRQFKVFTIPEACHQQFIKLRSTNTRPYFIALNKSSANLITSDSDKPSDRVKLHEYQKDAIQSWISANCLGILEMATGTGKTITSLSAAINRYKNLQRLVLVILVPYLHLLEQWERICSTFGFNPILCSSEHGNWQIEVKSKIQDFNINAIDNICIVAVHATASTEKFRKATKGLTPKYTMIIGDEVHGLGAYHMRKAMIPNAGMRLGLSATPRRWFDEEGTQAIFSYFGPVCFEFPLERAIGKYLAPYEYKPVLIHLTQSEMEAYEELTGKIQKLSSMLDGGKGEIEEVFKKLLLERALIIGSAEEKLNSLLIILKQMIDKAKKIDENVAHILVYCAPGTHKNVLRSVANLGLKCHEFVHTVSLNDRQKILDQFANGEIQVLVAVKCLDEGVDVPSTHMAFFLSSTTNPKEFVQRRGRILRLYKGKDKAILYDFIVTPSPDHIPFKRDIDAGLLKREMPRFAEFSSASLNEFEARSLLWELLNYYEMLNLFDEKPWDIYHKNMEDKNGCIL